MPRPESNELLRVKVEGCLNLIRVHRELDARAVRILEDEGVFGMTLAQATALLILVQARSPITAARLAELLNVSAVTVGRFVRSLEQNRWIRRRPDPGDARAMLLEPTEQTLDGLDRLFVVTDRLMEELYAGFSEREVQQMEAHLARARRNLYRAAGKLDIRPQVML